MKEPFVGLRFLAVPKNLTRPTLSGNERRVRPTHHLHNVYGLMVRRTHPTLFWTFDRFLLFSLREQKRGRHFRVLRGGSWNNNHNNTRAANRNRNNPDNRNNNRGFRVVRRVVARTLHSQSWSMGIGRAYRRRVQTYPGDEGDFIQI